MKGAILEVKNLTKKFGNFLAVDNISFSLKEGEILGFLGPNGAGKTTTIQMLLGVTEPTTGEISYFNKEFKKNKEDILGQINFSSTYISLPWLLTVSESLEVFARLYEINDRKKRIKKLLSEFEVEHLIKKQFYMLSAGEKTRVLLAKAFLNYPKILLLDEPTASLDPDIAIKIREFIKKERREYNVSVLLTSHNMSEVEDMGDRVLVLNHGKIIEEGTPEMLARRVSDCIMELTIPKNLERAISILEENKLTFERDRLRFRITLDEKKVAEILMSLAKAKVNYDEISIDKPDLEDYFLKIVRERND
ncbi:MAG: ABC transporter ATP-binding protein [Patescibacteria group bacterium]|nr:ABC transporter ATP-binding protein [Patescibacteria group bacterium]